MHPRHEIGAWERFFRTLLSSLNPRTYHILTRTPITQSMRYFVQALLFCTAVMLLLAIPNLFGLPSYIETELGSFNTLNVDITQEMNSPFVLTPTNPLLIIDSTGEAQPGDAKVVITPEGIAYHFLPFTEAVALPLQEGDILQNRQAVANAAWTILLLMLPGLILWLLLSIFVKYLLLILIAAVLGFILTGIIRFQIRFVQLFNVAIYSTTIALVIELFTKPFLVSSFYLHYVFFGIYFILGLISAGDFEPSHPKRAERRPMMGMQ